MRTEQILTALKVAETGNITRTAKELYLTQNGVTERIAALEGELGFKLFERTGDKTRPLVVTKRGRWWLDHAKRALEALEAGQRPDGRTLRKTGYKKVRKGDGL